jgi:DnaK suppressor protein
VSSVASSKRRRPPGPTTSTTRRGATLAFERQHVAALAQAAREHLADIDAALARLADGSYGTCRACGQPIGAERLAARPAARTCIGCAGRR